jgi:tetratricopeptide (TPR) repeat protein
VSNLAEVYRAQEKYDLAEALHLRALDIRQLVLGLDHMDVAQSQSNLALVYVAQARYREAEPLLKRSLEVLETELGPDHIMMAPALEHYAVLLNQTSRASAAIQLKARADQIRARNAAQNQ